MGHRIRRAVYHGASVSGIGSCLLLLATAFAYQRHFYCYDFLITHHCVRGTGLYMGGVLTMHLHPSLVARHASGTGKEDWRHTYLSCFAVSDFLIPSSRFQSRTDRTHLTLGVSRRFTEDTRE